MGGISVGIVLDYALPAAVYGPGDLASAISAICAAAVATMGLISSFALSEGRDGRSGTPQGVRG